MNEIKAVVKACGDYVSFHEMSLYIYYVFGRTTHLDALDEMDASSLFSDEEKQFLLQVTPEKNLTQEEQKKLDEMVERYVDAYEGDYCDFGYFTGIEVKDEIYISI